MVQCLPTLDQAFAAVADPIRRGVLDQLGRRDASISELAGTFAMTLTGIKKHVAVLEGAGLVVTRKVGRVRTCSLGRRTLVSEVDWLLAHQQRVEARYQKLDALLARMQECPEGSQPTPDPASQPGEAR